MFCVDCLAFYLLAKARIQWYNIMRLCSSDSILLNTAWFDIALGVVHAVLDKQQYRTQVSILLLECEVLRGRP